MFELTQEMEDIKRQLKREIARLNKISDKIERMQRKERGQSSTNEKMRIKKLEGELKEKYPDIRADKKLLRLVGTMKYNPLSKDKQIIRRTIAEHFE